MREITQDGAERLAYAIVRRAYEDYYTSILPNKLPNRPKVTRVVRGKTVKEVMTDHEFHLWLVERMQRAKRRREGVELFLWSPWYDTLVDMEPDGKTERINLILSELEYRRKNNIGMFANDFDDELED